MVDPEQPPEELRSIDAQLKPGFTLFAGYAVYERGKLSPPYTSTSRMPGWKLRPTSAVFSRSRYQRPQKFELKASHGHRYRRQTRVTKTSSSAIFPMVSGQPAGFLLDMKKGSGQHEVDEEPHLKE